MEQKQNLKNIEIGINMTIPENIHIEIYKDILEGREGRSQEAL